MEEVLVIVAIDCATFTDMPFDYSGDMREWVATIGFNMLAGSTKEIKFEILRNNQAAGLKEVLATVHERFIKIPFKAESGDLIQLQATNMIDTTDIMITYKSIGQ